NKGNGYRPGNTYGHFHPNYLPFCASKRRFSPETQHNNTRGSVSIKAKNKRMATPLDCFGQSNI
ncbi:MAG: hypothetical protein RR206_05170, partial [Bacteroidaceae bacterium]